MDGLHCASDRGHSTDRNQSIQPGAAHFLPTHPPPALSPLQPPWLLGGAAVEWSDERLMGMVFGFVGAALAAGAYICIHQIGRREHPLTVAM